MNLQRDSTRVARGLLAAACSLLAATHSSAQHVTLTIATHYTDDQRAPLSACLRQYEQIHPNITIVHTQLSFRDMLQTIFMARMGGKPPDIYNLSTAWTRQLVDSGALAPPPSSVVSFVRQSYIPTTVDASSARGVPWGIPSETDIYMLVYNRRLFERAGIARPPSTEGEWIAAATRISAANRQGQLITSGFSFGSSQNQVVAPFLTMLFSGGESLLSPDQKSTRLTTPAAHRALESAVQLFRNRGAAWGTVPYQFPSGALGMMIVPNWFQKSLRQGLESRFDQTVAVAPIPGGPNWRTLQYGFFWAVDASTPHPEEAWALLTWLNSTQGPGGRSCVGNMLLSLGALTGNKSDLAASAAELHTPFMQPFVDALSSGRALPQASMPHANEIEALLAKYLEKAMLGVISTDEALNRADRDIRHILEERE